MPITKREDVYFAYGDVASSARFNAILDSLISDLEQLESINSQLKDFLMNKLIIGFGLEYDETNKVLTIKQGAVTKDGEYLVQANDVSMNVLLYPGDVVVYNTNTKAVTVRRAGNLEENDIPLGTFTASGFDYSIRPRVSDIPNGEIYEPLIFAVESAALQPITTKGIQYRLNNASRFYFYDYITRGWKTPILYSEEFYKSYTEATTLSQDDVLYTKHFIQSEGSKFIEAEIAIYSPETINLTVSLSDGTTADEKTVTESGTVYLSLELAPNSPVDITISAKNGSQIAAGTEISGIVAR